VNPHEKRVRDHARRLGVCDRVLIEHLWERASIREYDGGQSRDDAEAAAADDIIAIYRGPE
jgi:hypothetical protein